MLEAIDRLGYRPNAIARGLVTSTTKLVGVIVSDITNPFYPELLEAISARLAEQGLKMVLYNGAGQDEGAFVRLLLEQRVDGVECDSVCGENSAGAARAARHLLELGHRRIAVIADSPKASTSRDRVAGFRSALRRAGVPVPRGLVVSGDFRFEAAYEATRALLARRAADDDLLCERPDGLRRAGGRQARGRAVPQLLSVVGFDSLPMSQWELLELTTVRQPLPEMARVAVDLLAARIADQQRATARIVLPSKLVVRATTGSA